MIPGSVLNLCTCFELYKSLVFLDVFLFLKQFCNIYLAVLKFVFSASVLRFLQVFVLRFLDVSISKTIL